MPLVTYFAQLKAHGAKFHEVSLTNPNELELVATLPKLVGTQKKPASIDSIMHTNLIKFLQAIEATPESSGGYNSRPIEGQKVRLTITVPKRREKLDLLQQAYGYLKGVTMREVTRKA